MSLAAIGLITTASTASATPSVITETFASVGPTGPLELQLQEAIDQPATVTQGNNMTITVVGGSQVVPTTQSGVPVISIGGLQTLIPVPANSAFVSGSIVPGNWSFTDTNNVTTTGPLTVTECTGPGTGCTATPNGTVYPGQVSTSYAFLGTTTTPYLEASTGSATFSAGGTLTLPSWSFDVNANGVGTIQTTVSEFDTAATINLGGPATVALVAYPAAPVAGCLTTGGTCTQGAYQFQPIATTTINSPPAAPVLQPQTGNVSAGQCTTINPLNGATDTGTGDSADPASVVIVSQPANGSATIPTPGSGIIKYCNTGGTAATDTFTVTAADTLASPTLVSSPPTTETVNISYNSCSAGSGNVTGGSLGSLGTCSLSQAIILPVTPGQIVLSQSKGLPLDYLGSGFCPPGTGITPGITLNGDVQAACGAVSPLTVTNATGLDTGWTLTGQVTDFLDPAVPTTTTCDTLATYNNHCIPGGNLAWVPAAAVASNVVPGDTAQVAAGAPMLPLSPTGPSASLNPILQGASVQPNPVVEQDPQAGLNSVPVTMCSTIAGQSGGTFVCAAGLELLIPASVAEPVAGPFGPAYQATLTMTLS